MAAAYCWSWWGGKFANFSRMLAGLAAPKCLLAVLPFARGPASQHSPKSSEGNMVYLGYEVSLYTIGAAARQFFQNFLAGFAAEARNLGKSSKRMSR